MTIEMYTGTIVSTVLSVIMMAASLPLLSWLPHAVHVTSGFGFLSFV